MPWLYRADEENGTTTAGTTRWSRINPDCRQSHTCKRKDIHQTQAFTDFYTYITGHSPLIDSASRRSISRWTLNRRFDTFWYIDVPNTPDPYRVYDQVFIDGTYTAAGCLLVAATRTHVICWYWTKAKQPGSF